MADTCPSCGMTDEIKKVSSVVGAQVTLTHTTGTARGGFGGVGYAPSVGLVGMAGSTTANINFSSYSASSTAQRLYPPARPTRRPFLVRDFLPTGKDHRTALAVAVVCLPLIMFADLGAGGPLGELLIKPLVGVAAIAIILLIRRRRDEQRISAEYPLWVRRAALWSIASYCARCDVVVIPAGMVRGPLTNGKWFRADHLHTELFKAARDLDENDLSQLAGR